MKIKANLEYKPSNFQMDDCQIEKVVELSAGEFAELKLQPLQNYQFIAENKDFMFSRNGVMHCLLALGEGSDDGVLIESEGYDYARYAAYVPGMRDILSAQLERAVDYVVEQDRHVLFEELEDCLGLAIRECNGLDAMLLETLERRPEVAGVEFTDGGIHVDCQPEFGEQAMGPTM